MSIYQLLKIILRGIGAYALWKSISSFTLLIGVAGMAASSYMGPTNSVLVVAIISNLILFLVPASFGIFALVRTEKIISLLGVSKNDETKLKPDSDLTAYFIVILVGTMFIINGSSSTLKLDYNSKFNYESKLINLDDMKNGAKPIMQKTNTTDSTERNASFSLFSLLELIFGVILLVKARSVTSFLIRRNQSKPIDLE